MLLQKDDLLLRYSTSDDRLPQVVFKAIPPSALAGTTARMSATTTLDVMSFLLSFDLLNQEGHHFRLQE